MLKMFENLQVPLTSMISSPKLWEHATLKSAYTLRKKGVSKIAKKKTKNNSLRVWCIMVYYMYWAL